MGRALNPQLFRVILVGWLLATSAPCCRVAQAHEDRSNLGYCPPPYPPGCVDTLSEHPEARPECTKKVEAYVASVFQYRTCLANEIKRAVREANNVLENLKCLEGKMLCPAHRDSGNAASPPWASQSNEGK
jgi:hypothetical protein